MPRIDIWDVQAAKNAPAVDCGFPRDLDAHFEWGRVLGKGGFGLVRIVVEKRSGTEFACKSVSKTLDIPNLSATKQAQHIDNVKREIKILTRLRGTLSVVHFKGAYEDDHSIHMVMEHCRGGELLHEVGRRPYTEKTIAGYMRSVLHTLAQCHSHRILHRDVKPGNFMLLTPEEDSPLKAIDFGLAVFFDPAKLPRTDLGLEGTPWFMAPETLSSQTFPASDVWAAGVMAYQLLSGYMPFDDPRNPNAPSLSVIWKGILSEQPSFRRTAWKEVSEEAKDFVKALLDKDHAKRPSAKEALRHPWLSPAFHQTRQRPISSTVVQRIQRFAQNNVVRRTILELIAQELLKMMPALSPTVHGPGEQGYMASHQHGHGGMLSDGDEASTPGAAAAAAADGGQQQHPDIFRMDLEHPGGGLGSVGSPPSPGGGNPLPNVRRSMDSGGGSGHGGDSFRGLLGRVASGGRSGSLHGGRSFVRSPSMQQLALLARSSGRNGGAATVHGPSEYWRVMRQASELAAMESGHGRTDYLRAAPRTEEERLAHRKAARLSLDTSAHGGNEFQRILRQLETMEHKHKIAGGMRQTKSHGNLLVGDQQQQQGAAEAAPSAAAAPLQQQQEQQQQQQQQRSSSGPTGWPQIPGQPAAAAAAAAATAAGPAGPTAAAAAAAAAAAPAAAAEADERGGGSRQAVPAAEERGRGRVAAKALLERLSAEPGSGGGSSGGGGGGLPPVPESTAGGEMQVQADMGGPFASRAGGGATSAGARSPDGGDRAPRGSKRVSFGGGHTPKPPAAASPAAGGGGGAASSGGSQQQQQQQPHTLTTFSAAAAAAAAAKGGGGGGSGGAVPAGAVTDPKELESLMRRMQFRSNKGLGPGEMSEGLRQLGYDLEPSEASILMQQLDLDADGQVQAPEFVASQMDWGVMQESNMELWLECARRAFAGLDADSDGRLSVDSLIGSLRHKLPAAEVDYAVEDALLEAGYADADEVDFEGFLKMVRVGSYDSLDALDQYDSRYGGSLHGRHSMDLDGSQHLAARLASVPEENTPRQTPRRQEP